MRISKVIVGLTAVCAALVVAGISLGSCMRSDPAGNVGAGPAPGAAIEVIATDDRFVPPTIEADAGEEITVEVENKGDSSHEFQIEELNLNTGPIAPGAKAHATFTVPEGVTRFVCSYHGGMEGQIVGV